MNHGSKPKKRKSQAAGKPRDNKAKVTSYGADTRFIFTRSKPTVWVDEFDEHPPVTYDPAIYN